VLFDKLDMAKMHGLDTSNVSCRVETRRAKWNLGLYKKSQREVGEREFKNRQGHFESYVYIRFKMLQKRAF